MQQNANSLPQIIQRSDHSDDTLVHNKTPGAFKKLTRNIITGLGLLMGTSAPSAQFKQQEMTPNTSNADINNYHNQYSHERRMQLWQERQEAPQAQLYEHTTEDELTKAIEDDEKEHEAYSKLILAAADFGTQYVVDEVFQQVALKGLTSGVENAASMAARFSVLGR